MRSIQQVQHKYELQNELRVRYKEFFESHFAVELLKHPEYFPSVKKISQAILALIQKHQPKIIDIIKSDTKIEAELRAPYFGHICDSKEDLDPEKALEKITQILESENPDLSQSLQIHCVFIYRIFDYLEKRNEKNALVKTLFPNFLFSKENRVRAENKIAEPVHHLGITQNAVFKKMLEKSPKKHIRAMEKYTPDCKSAFFQSAKEKEMPVVCGASGHAGSLLLGAKLYGLLTSEELREYVLASAAFFCAGGNHSFYEVMVVGNLIQANFSENYFKNIPESIKQADFYKKLLNQFPEFLEERVQISHASQVIKS